MGACLRMARRRASQRSEEPSCETKANFVLGMRGADFDLLNYEIGAFLKKNMNSEPTSPSPPVSIITASPDQFRSVNYRRPAYTSKSTGWMHRNKDPFIHFREFTVRLHVLSYTCVQIGGCFRAAISHEKGDLKKLNREPAYL